MTTTINPEFISQVERIVKALNGLDYFQLLRIKHDATHEEIRAGYHRQSRLFHPDRYHHMGSEKLSSDLTQISKRITEAYVVLRDEAKRDRYRRLVEGAERQQHLRYQETHEAKHRDQEQSRRGTTPQGRKLFEEAMEAWGRGQKKDAIRGLKMALLYEAENEHFREKLSEWSA